MAFLEDPRLRQRWNQITHDTETITENAAAGIWTFQHNYITPCFSSIAHSFEQCTTVCLGDPDDRIRRRRERELSHGRAEYSFDFYDDWYEEEQSGLFGAWGNEDWDRLLAGTGSQRKLNGGETEQPRKKRGMSYGTRDRRRKPSIDDDPTVIPSTQPIGFLSKLPWKVGGTLRYKPSAADLQDHPQRHGDGENEPLLHSDDGSDFELPAPRKRSGTTGSGDTSDSYRSRGDLFPSDGEGEEDAIPLDDEVTYDMVRKDDRSGRSGRTSSKGKRPAGGLAGSRTVSRTTLGSVSSRDDYRMENRPNSLSATSDVEDTPTLHDLEREEYLLQKAEDDDVERKKRAAAQLAAEKGLTPKKSRFLDTKPEVADDDVYEASPSKAACQHVEEVEEVEEVDDKSLPKRGESQQRAKNPQPPDGAESPEKTDFVPARLPHFQ